ncbi:MAG TPA: hypothetical protein P5117_06525, partial [Spirochaetia bacterium]|nr:hypothetical protein [Spirochaetia bacterium]
MKRAAQCDIIMFIIDGSCVPDGEIMKLLKTVASLFAVGLISAFFGCDDTITHGLELGATYYLGYYGSAADPATGTETVPVTVSGFRLDMTEVTVGEFREFVTDY